MFQTKVAEEIKTHFTFSNSPHPEIIPFITYTVEPDRPHMTKCTFHAGYQRLKNTPSIR
jgi:hypothetical protein